jgi:hypothetical protein
MDRVEILIPVLALTSLTLLVLIALGIFRIGGIATGRYSRRYYELFSESENHEPEFVRRIARNYHNLLELPILFYAGCLIAYAADLVSQSLIILAWVFVALRVIHTVIHLGYNRVTHRMTAFIAGSLVLMGFWLVLGGALLGQS